MKKKKNNTPEIIEQIQQIQTKIPNPADLNVALTNLPKLAGHIAAFQIQRTLHKENDKRRIKNGLGTRTNLEKQIDFLKNLLAIELLIGNQPTELGTTIGLGFIGTSVLGQAVEGLFPPIFSTLTNTADLGFNKVNQEARDLIDDIQKQADKLADKVKKET